jgi:predicted nucleic acid-binding protein
MAFVVDASVTMAWCFEDEKTEYTENILDRLGQDEAFVPMIWPWEVLNVLLIAERKHRLSPALADEFLDLLNQLPIVVKEWDWPSQAEALLLRGRMLGLTSYDTGYLELASRLACPLATQDEKMREAARKLGIVLLESGNG